MSTHPPHPSPLCCFLILFTTILSILLPQLPLTLFTPPLHIFLIVSYLALSVVCLIILSIGNLQSHTLHVTTHYVCVGCSRWWVLLE